MEFTGDLGGFDEVLGAGRWSTVHRCPSKSPSTSHPPFNSSNLLTPPPSPKFKPSSDVCSSSTQPEYYAVKVAKNRSSIPVLRHEATILSHLSSIRDHEEHTVPFHGFDARHNAIIFTALPETLESLSQDLSRLDEASRSEVISNLFPRIARSLTSSLSWLHAAGVIHSDLKPANILLRPDLPIGPDQSISEIPFTPLLADFTAAFLRDSTTSSTSALGGGTYDYLAPELLSPPCPTPSPSSDVYAMAITLLTLITGTSPFAAAGGNRFQLLAMIKAGMPLSFAMQDARSEKRLRSVAAQVKQKSGIDILRVLEMGLSKSSDRVSAEEWSRMF